MTTYRDTWEEDESGNRFIFTVEMKRKLARAGLPIEVDSLGELKAGAPPTPPTVQETQPVPEPEPVLEPDIIQIDPETGKYIGRLKWYNPTRGYGFISRGAGQDIFFHKTSAIGDPAEMEEGQWVLYDVEERTKGPEATEVELYTGELG